MDMNSATRKVKSLYSGLFRPALFTRIRFFTAPYKLLEELVPKQGLIIDLGCGYGIFSNLLAITSLGRQIIGIELNKKNLSMLIIKFPMFLFA